MKHFFLYTFFLFSVLCIAQTDTMPLAIINATVIDGTGNSPQSNATIIIKNQKIECIGQCSIPKNAKIINAKSKYVIPGLIDSHVHYSTNGWIDSFPIPGFVPDVSANYPYEEVLKNLKNNPKRFHRAYLCSGVTTVFDTGGYPWLFDIRNEAKDSFESPRYYTTGPLLSFEKQIFPTPLADEFLYNINDEKSLSDGIDFLIKMETDGVNLHNIHNAPNLKILEDRIRFVIEQFKNKKVRLMAFSKGLEEAKLAIKLGVKILIYSIDEELVDQEFLNLAIENDIIYVPTLGVSDALVNAQNGYIPYDFKDLECIDEPTLEKIKVTDQYYEEITDATQNSGTNIIPNPELASVRNKNLLRISKSGIRIAMGSSAGVPFLIHGPSSHNEMIEMVKAGLTPMEVIVASTKNGAHVIGNKEIGVLKKGKMADLIILNKNPLENINNIKEISMVIYAGNIIRE
ncbi:imidazolonepropionase-like amidohydrolase [Flavobacteriaceae bacterium MAR_2010_105]|nr:imidazolonepropionase-like amidohydrolase [Flavobacteriaceae bacterium MAR_2010_105]